MVLKLCDPIKISCIVSFPHILLCTILVWGNDCLNKMKVEENFVLEEMRDVEYHAHHGGC